MKESTVDSLDRTHFKQLRKDPQGYVCGDIPVKLLVELAEENKALKATIFKMDKRAKLLRSVED